MPIQRILSSGRHPIYVWTDDIEETALRQLEGMADLPIIHNHIAVMPDVHWGKGATVGSVIACKGAVIPAAVGVDIGCGMLAVLLNLCARDLPDSLTIARTCIEEMVPVGFAEHNKPWDADHKAGKVQAYLQPRLTGLQERYPGIVQRDPAKVWKQLGTLGGGNHFIELCLDQDGRVWLLLHSGSRNVGKTIADVFISAAKENAPPELRDKDLAWLRDGTQVYADYLQAVTWAQEYAMENRQQIRRSTLNALSLALGRRVDGSCQIINCHHNYVSIEEHFGETVVVTRKGAIRAQVGDLGIIPGSMGTRSYIVEGLGNQMSFNSCSHGAGRRMSRGQAKRTFTAEDFAMQTQGVECRKDLDLLDEIPGAYKDINEVMAKQADLARPTVQLKQILCVKG